MPAKTEAILEVEFQLKGLWKKYIKSAQQLTAAYRKKTAAAEFERYVSKVLKWHSEIY
jgi:hypothetical protein